MINIDKTKVIGASLPILNNSLLIKYGDDFLSTTQTSTTLRATMDTNTNETAVGTLLDAYAAVTCDASALAITLTLGDVIVSDVTNITADPTDKKFVLIVIALDDTTGDLEVHAFEKTTGEYGDLPADKTLAAQIKEYCVAAAGTTLELVTSYI